MYLIWAVFLIWACLAPPLRRFSFSFPAAPILVDRSIILDLAAASFRAGHSIPGALAAVGEALDEENVNFSARSLAEVSKALLLGADWEEAWENTPPRYRDLAAALAPAWNQGAAPVALLERSALTLRLTRARRAKEAAARLGARLVIPLVSCFLPAFMLIGVFPIVVGAGEKIF